MNARLETNGRSLPPGGPIRAFARLGGRIARPVVDRTGIGRASEQLVLDGVDLVLRSRLMREIADRVIESPSAERLVARVIESRLMDEAVNHLLESEDLWILVDEVVRSPAVTAAISQQGIGFADQVAAAVRDRSRRADARLEHAARRLVRRSANGALEQPPAP